MEDPTLDALKRDTEYEHIHARPSGYVIRVENRNRARIKGLVRNRDGFYLDYTKFDTIPISFLIEDPHSGQTWQYWTLRKKMHRENGPAYVHYDPNSNSLTRRYFYFGLGHNDHGPFQEAYSGYTIDVDTFPSHFIETWDRADYEWMVHGDTTKKYTRWARLGSGQCYRRKLNRELDSPEDFGPTLLVDKLSLEFLDWMYVKERQREGVMPHKLEFTNLSEDYVKGKLTGRHCDSLVSSWIKEGKLHTPAFEGEESWISRFSDGVRKNLLKYMDIWGGDIYPDEEAEFLFLTEFNSYYENKG